MYLVEKQPAVWLDRFPHRLAASPVNHVPHPLRLLVPLPQHPLPRAEAQHPCRVAGELRALRKQQRGEHVHLVEKAAALLEVRRLPSKEFFECLLTDRENHGVLEGLRGGHLPRVVEELDLSAAVARLQGGDGPRVLRGPQVPHVHALRALGLGEVDGDLAQGARDEHLADAADLAGEARAHDEARHGVADFEGRPPALGGGDHLRVPAQHPARGGEAGHPEALGPARPRGEGGAGLAAARPPGRELRAGGAAVDHAHEELLLPPQALRRRGARHHGLDRLVVAAGQHPGDELEGAPVDHEELGGELTAP
mmetsp:Transcript_67267/g.212852  ORF Transcript_67267/g.212852 Transcript_67267/m.212852 type:complete len:310 (+) Transcript_67267:1545-2474(+)